MIELRKNISRGMCTSKVHHANWLGAGGTNSAKSPHEQKMANILGTWRSMFSTVFYVMVAIPMLLSHKNFAPKRNTAHLILEYNN